MNSVISALPIPSSPPAAEAQTKNASGPDSDTIGTANFSTMLMHLSSQKPGNSDPTAAEEKPMSRRTVGKSKLGDAAESAAAMAAIVSPTPTPISPNELHGTPAIAAAKTGIADVSTPAPSQLDANVPLTSVRTLPAAETGQPALSPNATNQSSAGVSHTSPPKFEPPTALSLEHLAPTSALVQPPVQTVPAVPAVDSAAENSATGHERVQLPTKDASATPPAGAKFMEAPSVDSTSRAAPAAAPVRDQVHDQITSHMEQLQQTGRVEAQFSLHPPELGRVQLHLTLEDGRLNVRMLVQDDNAKRLIDQQFEPLRVRFAEMGVSVGQFDVRRDGSSAQSEHQQSAEPSAQTLQPSGAAASTARKSYAKVANSAALVDLIA